MECIDFIEGQPEALDIGTSVLEFHTCAKFDALHIFFHFILVGMIVQIRVGKGPSKELFDVLALDGSQRCVEKPARQISGDILGTLLT